MCLNDMRADLWKSLGARGDASGGFFEIFFRAISKKKPNVNKLYRIFNTFNIGYVIDENRDQILVSSGR